MTELPYNKRHAADDVADAVITQTNWKRTSSVSDKASRRKATSRAQ